MSKLADKKRWQRKPEQRPDAILDSALLLFRAKGFTGTRIEDIAKGAGLSKGAVYLYFDSKEHMLKSLIERAVLPLVRQIETLSNHADQAHVVPALQTSINLAAKQLQNPDIAAIPLLIISESGQFPELATYYRTEVLERIISAFAGLLKKGKKEGLFRDDLNPHFAVRTLMGNVLLQVIWLHVFAGKGTNTAEIEQQLTHHLDIFLRGISQS